MRGSIDRILAISGHAAALPSAAMNARRLIPGTDIKAPENGAAHHNTRIAV